MLLDKIKEILNEKHIEAECTRQNTLKLKEDGKDARLTEVKLIVPNGEHLLCKFDNNNKKLKTSFFNSKSEVYSICDYILFSVLNNKLYVFILNIKSGNTDNNMIQLCSGEALAKYIIQTANKYLEHYTDPSDIYFSYILFSTSKESRFNNLPGDSRLRYISKDGRRLHELSRLMNLLYTWERKPKTPNTSA